MFPSRRRDARAVAGKTSPSKMAVEDTGPLSERAQTDDSLRVEREKADHALEEELAAIDEIADAVISRARARADAVLAAARTKTDRQPALPGPSAPSPTIIETEKRLADEVLREERADVREARSTSRCRSL